MPDLVTLGETCVVMVADSAGPLRYATTFERRAGGAECTVAAGVARLGFSAGWMSKLGDDEFGAYLASLMRGENVDVSRVALDASGQTGTFFRENRAGGNSAVYYYRANSAFTSYGPADLDPDYIAASKFLHLTGITPGLSKSCRGATEAAMEIARANGVRIVFDLNYRAKIWAPDTARPVLEALMKRADQVLVGREDLIKLIGVSDRAAQLDYLSSLGLGHVVLKSGAEGATLIDGDGTAEIPSIPAKQVVDRFGVGDAFAAGYIVGQLKGWSNRDSIGLGNKVAGWSIRLPGNLESLPDWRDLKSFDDGIELAGR